MIHIMKLSELYDGQIVEYRLGRAGEHNVNWGEWKTGPIVVFRRQKDYKRGKTLHPAGEILILTPKNDVWAQHGEKQEFAEDTEGGYFVTEDYYMQIKGLTR